MIPKEDLYEMYWGKKMSSPIIANEIGVTFSTVLRWMRLYGIKRRTVSEAYKIRLHVPVV